MDSKRKRSRLLIMEMEQPEDHFCTMYNASTTCAITLNSNGFTRTNHEF